MKSAFYLLKWSISYYYLKDILEELISCLLRTIKKILMVAGVCQYITMGITALSYVQA